MVFKAKNAKTYKVRVVAPSGNEATHSTGCTLEGDADDVERVVREWQGDSPQGKKAAKPAVLELLCVPIPKTRKGERKVVRDVSLMDLYQKHLDGTLDEWMTARDLAAVAAAVVDPDLHAHVGTWHTRRTKSKKGAAMADQYLRQLHDLYPKETPFTLSMWTRKEIKTRLEALPVQDASRNRFKAAASSFNVYLLDEELVEMNVVRTIPGWSENDARQVWYSMGDAKRLIPAMEAPYRGYSAILAAFCMEMSAMKRLRVGDVLLSADPVKAHARGTKRSWRDRWVPLVPEVRWLLPFVKEAFADKHPDALVYDVADWRHLKKQHEAADRLTIVGVGEDVQGQHNLHDWRHSHAVWLAQHGYPGAIGMAHLGHKDMTMYNRIYANHRPDAHDYALHEERQEQRRSTTSTTSHPAKGRKGA